MSTDPAHPADAPSNRNTLAASLGVLLLLLVFLAGIRGLGDGFRLLGSDLLDAFFSATSNPFVALMVGILSTTLVQRFLRHHFDGCRPSRRSRESASADERSADDHGGQHRYNCH